MSWNRTGESLRHPKSIARAGSSSASELAPFPKIGNATGFFSGPTERHSKGSIPMMGAKGLSR
jgi:hypothetical protein